MPDRDMNDIAKKFLGNGILEAFSIYVSCTKDSFITQDRNEDFEGGQVESTFSQGHCDLTSGTISKK